MDDSTKGAAQRVADFYFVPPVEVLTVADQPDELTWGRIALGLEGPDRDWFLSLHDAVRDLARTIQPHPGTPVDVTTGVMSPTWNDEAARKAAAVSRLWSQGRWDEVELHIGDGSGRKWFQALADAVRELHRELAPAD